MCRLVTGRYLGFGLLAILIGIIMLFIYPEIQINYIWNPACRNSEKAIASINRKTESCSMDFRKSFISDNAKTIKSTSIFLTRINYLLFGKESGGRNSNNVFFPWMKGMRGWSKVWQIGEVEILRKWERENFNNGTTLYFIRRCLPMIFDSKSHPGWLSFTKIPNEIWGTRDIGSQFFPALCSSVDKQSNSKCSNYYGGNSDNPVSNRVVHGIIRRRGIIGCISVFVMWGFAIYGDRLISNGRRNIGRFFIFFGCSIFAGSIMLLVLSHYTWSWGWWF